MRDEKGNITIKSVYKWLRSDKGKKYSFAIFYLLFFIIIFVFFATPNSENLHNDTNNIPENEPESTLPFITSKLENEDYKFTYQILIDDEEQIYNGLKQNQKITLTTDDKTLNYEYKDGNLVSEEENNNLETSFLDIFEIKRIIKNSELISEVKYPSTNKYAYNYEINGSDLGEILKIDNSSLDTNEIVVEANENKDISSITINIVNFMSNIKEDNYSSYKIIITYGDIDE